MRSHEHKYQEARKDAGKNPELSVGRLVRRPEREHDVPEQESRQKPLIVCDHLPPRLTGSAQPNVPPESVGCNRPRRSQIYHQLFTSRLVILRAIRGILESRMIRIKLII